MRMYLVILIFLSGTVFARYYDKTRFDRSVHERETSNIESRDYEKQWFFTDDVTQFVVYKSKEENDCYIENIEQNQNASHKKRQLKVLYASTALTKLEAWRLAGGRIVDFCHGRTIILLQTTKPEQTFDPFLNEIPIDENDISSKRVADVVLTPLISRTKRRTQLEQRKRLNENYNRIRRQTSPFRGRFRGQTQSQYLNVGNGEQKEGKAEAEATQQSSRAVVSGNRGMGQAQSMSSGGTGCEDCPGYPGYTGIGGVPSKVPGTGIVPGGVPYPGGITPGEPITHPGRVVPGGIVTYPGVVPGTRPGTYPGVIQPGVTPSENGRIYPPGVRPGTVTPGGDQTYPGSIQPGTIRPGDGRIYPVQPGVVSPGGVYPGTITPGDGGTYPGGVQPGVVTPGGVQPGVVTPGGVQPGVVIPGGVQPGGVQPGVVIPGTVIPGDRIYPPGTLVTGPSPYPGSIQPGRISPGTVTGTGTSVGPYPGGIQNGIQPGPGIYPGGVTTSVMTSATAGTYPGGVVPGIGLPSGTYPGGTLSIGTDGTYPRTKIPPGVQPDTGVGAGTYPGGVVPGINQGVYPGGGQQTSVFYPGGVVPGTLPGGAVTYPTAPGGQISSVVTSTGSVAGTGTQVTYPGGRPMDGRTVYPGLEDATQPGRIPGTVVAPGTYPGAGTYPGGGTVPTTYPVGGQPQVVYPGGTQQATFPGETLYPGQGIYPGGQVTTYPGGLYPGAGVPGTGVPGEIQYPIGTIGDQSKTGGIDGQRIDAGPTRPYPGAEEPSLYTRTGTGGPVGVADDGAESQASSSVQQVQDSGTQASASAQGKYAQGTAQSQVTGTYSGSGTFSAQAGTSDADKSAQAEISGGKEGATSNAEGIAGYGKSQAQVQLDSDSGATSTGAQSSGWNHGTNSQVQASSKGGMADAQANGEGSTSSQAQIGFQPYLKKDEKMEIHATPFHGSGTASAQSGTHRGQSQSQLQGSFQYGITYTGAAQAGSGSGAASSRKSFNFSSVADTEFFKPFKPQDSSRKMNVESAQSSPLGLSSDNENKQNDREQGLQSSSSSKQTVVVGIKDTEESVNKDKKILITDKPRRGGDALYDEYDDEYVDDYDDTTMASSLLNSDARSFTRQRNKAGKTAQRQTHQSQVTQVAKGNGYDIHVSQDSNVPRPGDILQPGQSLSGFTVPPGFRGRVMSISGTETVARGDGKSQSQTVSLIPKNFNNTKPPVTNTRSLQINHERHVDRRTSNSKSQDLSTSQSIPSDKYTTPTPSSVPLKPSYYTVTNSVAGKMNGNAPRKYEHRYYTKSSTCGYFTFSCNVVYGSNGRTKICKPKVPTYPDGTPMRC